MFDQLHRRINLKLGFWVTFISWYLPRRWRSRQTNTLLNLADKQLQKVDRAFDVSNIVEQHEDIILLLKLIFDKKRLWLFKRQRARLVSQKRKCLEEDKSQENEHIFITKFFGDKLGKVQIDNLLLSGILGSKSISFPFKSSKP